MNAAQAFNGHFLPKKCFGKRTLRECTSRKRDNIVLIEVDCDDIGDVIILDVPESFRQKFKKVPEDHVIKLDDDDDGGESRGGACNTDTDATTSNRVPATSAAPFSTCGNVDEDCLFVSEGNTPVKLSKSKRTYSGNGISRNRYGLSADSESCSSESDDSDCEFLGGSFGKSHEQQDKASFRRRHDTSCDYSDLENIVGTSAPDQSGHNSAEGGPAESPSHQSNLRSSFDHETNSQKLAEESKFSQQSADSEEIDGLFTGSCSHPDLENKAGVSASDQPIYNGAEQSTAEESELLFHDLRDSNSLNHDNRNLSHDSAEELAQESKCSQQDCDAKDTGKVCPEYHSTNVTESPPSQDVESEQPAINDTDQGAGSSMMLSNHKSSNGYCSEANSFADQNDIIIDRQKIKETDEYKRAMEEEWASRQQQLQRQAEEARRQRSKKRAEHMRIMVNERRQKQRVEEIRETRRKDEENLNLKEKLRVEIREELRRLEAQCGDMASLLRSLGIHVGGGFFPSPNEVQAAYKRACLKFHPDRLSKMDLRQQVEAEEKFKLISNMKDKFCSKFFS